MDSDRPPERGVHWRGHVLSFGTERSPTYDQSAGLRLLLIWLLLEAIVGPRLSLFSLLGLPLPSPWLRVPLLLGFALVLVRFFAGLDFHQIGLYPWRKWSRTERSYFVQTLVIANIIFIALFVDRLHTILNEPSSWGRMCLVMATTFLWGVYQEIVYRGILQTELVRRMGFAGGIVVSNLLFTFGPLHFYHFFQGSSAFFMFAGIFAIGLFFALLFQRSGNLWMVATFHGLGGAYIIGTIGQ